MSKERLKEILYHAIIAYEFELEEQDYSTAEALHEVVLNEFTMTEEEYMEIMNRRYIW